MLNEVFYNESGMFPIASIFKHIKFRSAYENKFERCWCQLTWSYANDITKKNVKMEGKGDLAESCFGK